MLFGVIADDITGATDIALMLLKGGMRTTQVIGVPEPGAMPRDADAVVVALKSRTAPVEEAVAQSLRAGFRHADHLGRAHAALEQHERDVGRAGYVIGDHAK